MEVCRDYTDNCYRRNPSDTEPVVEFLATVFIPKGFVLCDEDYETYLTIDKQDLSEVRMTKNHRCGPSDDCTTSSNCVLLNGKLTYNVTLEYFRAACLLESDNVTKEALFHDHGDIYMNKILICSRREIIIPIPEYSIIPVQGEEFITSITGRNIFRMSNKWDFITLLENPDIEKVIHIPYSLFVVMNG